MGAHALCVSGYLTADELYDGPFCVLSIVDNRTFKRLFYQVLDHAPAQADLLAFFGLIDRHMVHLHRAYDLCEICSVALNLNRFTGN